MAAADHLISNGLKFKSFDLTGERSGLALKRHEEQEKKEKRQSTELAALREQVAALTKEAPKAPSVAQLIAKAEKAAQDAARPQSSASSAIAQERADRLAVKAQEAVKIKKLAAQLPASGLTPKQTRSGLALKRHEAKVEEEKKRASELAHLREKVAALTKETPKAPSVKELIAKAEKAAQDAARPQSSSSSAIAQERANKTAADAHQAIKIAKLAAELPIPKVAQEKRTIAAEVASTPTVNHAEFVPSTVVEAPSSNHGN
ncbi:hypothetical protein M3Y96_00374700 [Aphelenchoides besseyi]|nr:hypothetical protein M3Y96_00374700 [Aphelenchoides besseyi]